MPFRLRSGKAIGAPRQEVTFTFKQPPWVPAGLTGHDESDRLRLSLGASRLGEPVLNAWRAGDVPLEEYAAGSPGPQGWPT